MSPKRDLPTGFADKRMHGQSTTARPYFSTDMGPFYQWLREFYDDPTMEPIVDLTCAHIFETYPTPMGQEVFNRVAPKQIWLTVNEARKKTGFGVMFLKRFLGYMNGLDETEAVLRTDVHADELAKVQAYWETLLNLETAASLLGISSGQVKLLQDCGVLTEGWSAAELTSLWSEAALLAAGDKPLFVRRRCAALMRWMGTTFGTVGINRLR